MLELEQFVDRCELEGEPYVWQKIAFPLYFGIVANMHQEVDLLIRDVNSWLVSRIDVLLIQL